MGQKMLSSKVKHRSLEFYFTVADSCIASHVVRPECLGLLMHFTVMQDIQHRLMPGLGPSSGFPLDEFGIERLQKITQLAFAPGKNL